MNNNKINVIGIYSPAPQSGKDTIGNYLVEKHGFVRVGFADKVRESLYKLNPLVHVGWHDPIEVQKYLEYNAWQVIRVRDLVDTFGWETAKAVREVRELLQRMGTEVGRETLRETIWLELLEKKVRPILADGGRVVVTDMRFDNEATILSALGRTRLIKVTRPGAVPPNGHKSEGGLSDFFIDYHLKNNGTIADLTHQVELLKIF